MTIRKHLTKTQRETATQEFEAWLDLMDLKIREFVTSVSSNVGAALDCSPNSLDAVEKWLLETYPSLESLRDESEKQTWDGVARYVGETFRRNAGGRWEIRLDDPDYVFFQLPQISFTSSAPACPHSLCTAALDRRTGIFLSTILANKIADMKESQKRVTPT